MRDYQLFLKDIISAIESIQSFVKGLSLEEMQDDDRTASAVVLKFAVIGEAVRKIPDEFRRQHPEVPWKEMAGMRDRLIHFYFGIDYGLVWKTIREDLPRAKLMLERLLAGADQRDSQA